MTPLPVGTRIREIATGDLGTVVSCPRKFKLDPLYVWAKWDGGKYAHQPVMRLPASEVEAVTEPRPDPDALGYATRRDALLSNYRCPRNWQGEECTCSYAVLRAMPEKRRRVRRAKVVVK